MKGVIVLVVCLSLVAAVGCGHIRHSGEPAPGPPGATNSRLAELASVAAGTRATATPEATGEVLSPPPAFGSRSSGCGSDHASGESEDSFGADGLMRSYRLYVPSSYSSGQPMSLVLNFHGLGSNAEEQEAYTRFPEKAEASGFITVAPNGTGQPQAWYLAGSALPGSVDDFSFVRQLIDRLEQSLCIDTSRVYATGMSNGAGLTSLLACELNDRIAAIAPVAGEGFSELECSGKSAVPIRAFHGTDDPLVSFDGGSSPRGIPVKPTRETMRSWAEFNGCGAELQSERVAPDVWHESYGGCADGADVGLYVIEGGGHTWPGAHDLPVFGATTHSIDATDLIWEFFAGHSLQR